MGRPNVFEGSKSAINRFAAHPAFGTPEAQSWDFWQTPVVPRSVKFHAPHRVRGVIRSRFERVPAGP